MMKRLRARFVTHRNALSCRQTQGFPHRWIGAPPYDAAIVAGVLPKLDGCAVVRELRELKVATPIWSSLKH
ncbi:MAG: hypothetical protein H0U23_01835 [Blastocatellia bacterium]|nr:hypothetical protein [Blastocatellia bacterium]